MQKLKQKLAHRTRISTNSPVNNTSSPPESHPESSSQQTIDVTSSPAKSEALGTGGDVSKTEHDPPWGLKLLCEGIDPIVDIVAIHGLNGHHEKTWTFEGKGKTKDVLWLRDLLPSIIPNARIWSWGYDSRTRSKSHGEQLTIKSLYDHGRELVFDLDGERRASNSHRRPIIFIVHSLGGIVLKSALLHSDRVREGNLEEQRSIKISTYGIIFMGTPHQGGQGVGIGKIMLNVAKAQGHTSDKLLKHLEVHSEILQQQLSEFTSIHRDFKTYFAYETKPTPIVGGVAMVIVPKWSAVVPGTPDTAEFGISEDHRRMTKFSNDENADFGKIVRLLTSMIQNSGAKIESNWSVEAVRKRAVLGAKAFHVPFNIRGVPIVNKYVERDREMSTIENLLRPGVVNTQRRIVVLHGLGGTGKTQLSLAYARKHRDDHTAIAWLNGQTQDSLKQSIAGVARSLPAHQLPNSARDNLQQGSEGLEKAIDEVLEWFGQPGNTQWLLIYDNVDRDASDEAQDPEAYDIRKYFPNSDQGSIIVTTRRLQLRHLGDELKVTTMTIHEGMDLLRNTSGDLLNDISSATTLVNRLGALPLALTQAAAYIRETNSTIAEYLVSYDTAWDGLMKDGSHPDFAPREYGYRSVYTTWSVSVECVKQKNEDAVSMLQLWSYLDNKDVWFGLFNNEQNWNLERWTNLPQWFRRVMGKDVDFRRAVRILLAYSLIEVKEDSDAFAMHPVVHDWCRETLGAGKRHEFMWLAITVVGFAVPFYVDRSYWEIELRLLPHTSRCIVLLDNVVEESLQRDDLLDLNTAIWSLGCICKDQLKLAEAEAMFQWALESEDKHSKRERDQDSDLTPEIHNSLGTLYLGQNKLEKAEAMFQRALTGFENLLGSDKEQMTIINNLGILYAEQGKLAEAEAMYKRALAWYTDTLGPDHVETVNTANNLGDIYRRQGNLAEAESLLKRALVVRENELGPEHPMTLDTVSNLGNCHRDQDRLAEAEAMYRRALSGREKILGPDHTKTLDACYDLGNALFAQEKFPEAEVRFERALSGREKILGPDHTKTLNACHNLGSVLFAQEKFVEAEVRFERTLSGYKDNKDYKWTRNSAIKLSRIYEKQGRLAEAEAMWRPLVAEYEATLGLDHELTLDLYFEIGLVLTDQNDEGKLLEAEVMYQRALSGYKNNKNYEWTKNAAIDLSRIYEKQGRLAEAEVIWRPLLAEYEATLGLDHELTLDLYFIIGGVLTDQDDEGKLLEAEVMYQRALSGYKKVLGIDHEPTVLTFYNLGLVLKHQMKLHEAEDMFEQALSGFIKIKGRDHQDAKGAAQCLSEIYEEQGRDEEAEAILQSVS